MPRKHPRKFCRICQKHRDEVGDLSTRGKCQGCAIARIEENALALANHDGPFHQHWRRQVARSVGYGPLDDPIHGR